MPTPDRRPRGHNRRAQQRRKNESQVSLMDRIKAATLPLYQRISQMITPHRQPASTIRQWRSPLPRYHVIGLAVLCPVWLLLIAWDPTPSTPPVPPSGSLNVPLAVPAEVPTTGQPDTAKPVEETVNGTWLQHDVLAGETLYSIFRKFELPGAELSRLIAVEGPDRPLTRLQSGHSVFILVDTSRRIKRVEIRSYGQAIYRYDRQGESFTLKN